MIRPAIPFRQRQIVVDVDTQKHFFLDNGPICVRNHRRVSTNIRKVMAWIRTKHVRLISTIQTFSGNAVRYDPSMTGVFSVKKIDSTLCSNRASYDATDSTDFPREMLEQRDQVILHKRCFDPFEEPRADRILTESEADEYILIGALTEGSIRATALGLLRREKEVTVLVDAIGSYNEKAAKLALRHMQARGARLAYTETLLSSPALPLVRRQPYI
jgi:nicotinamidase-related amidase